VQLDVDAIKRSTEEQKVTLALTQNVWQKFTQLKDSHVEMLSEIEAVSLKIEGLHSQILATNDQYQNTDQLNASAYADALRQSDDTGVKANQNPLDPLAGMV